jgi:1-phosphofructokinase family hexose kinase
MRLVSIAPNPSIDRLYELDRLRIDAVNRPGSETLVAGGKGLNVARAAASLGADVTAVALLAGHAGRWIADALAGEGIAARLAWCDGETRSCIAIHDAHDESLTELNEAGPSVDQAAWERLVGALRAELLAGSVGAVGLVTVSGSLPPGAPSDGIAQLVAVSRAAGVPIGVDCSGEALRRALLERPTLVKLNLAEAEATISRARTDRAAGTDGTSGSNGDEARAVALARELTERTGGATIVTRGLGGAVAVAPDGRLMRISPPAVRGSYPVGSGDAFLAGVATAMLRGSSFDEALRLGAAAAAANSQRRGAGRLEPAKVRELLPNVSVEPILD